MRLILCTAAAALLASASLAQVPLPGAKVAKTSSTTTSATTAATTPKAAPKAAPKPRTAASLQCSKDADAKNIHGKPRKAFMSSCKKAAAKG